MSRERGRILLVSTCRYPEGDAGAVRLHSLALLAVECGYEPIVVALGATTGGSRVVHDGVEYTSLRGACGTLVARLWGRLSFGRRVRPWLGSTTPLSAVLVVDIPFPALRLLARECWRRGVPLLHDSVEWYSASEFALGVLNPAYIHKEILNQWVVGRGFRVIAISQFLEQHFRSKGICVERIPAILDVASIQYGQRASGGVLRFLYSGSPGRKDRLVEFCRAVGELGEERERIRIDFLGFTSHDLIGLGVDRPTLARLEGILTCHGRVPREEALRQLTRSDFSILFRNPADRYARAGFPTKVVESLASGTPVFLNVTSDLGGYLVDGREAIICADAGVREIKAGLERALALSPKSLARMRTAARTRAVVSFDYRVYRQAFLRLLEVERA